MDFIEKARKEIDREARRDYGVTLKELEAYEKMTSEEREVAEKTDPRLSSCKKYYEDHFEKVFSQMTELLIKNRTETSSIASTLFVPPIGQDVIATMAENLRKSLANSSVLNYLKDDGPALNVSTYTQSQALLTFSLNLQLLKSQKDNIDNLYTILLESQSVQDMLQVAFQAHQVFIDSLETKSPEVLNFGLEDDDQQKIKVSLWIIFSVFIVLGENNPIEVIENYAEWFRLLQAALESLKAMAD